MADQIGTSSTNSLLIIIPSRGDVDWDQDIKNLCFEPISSHDHTGNGNGHTIGTGALEDGAVTHPKLGDASVKEDKIFTGAVISSKIATGAVTQDKLATDSVTNLKIGAAQVDQTKLDAPLNILINKIDPMRADITAAEAQIIFDGINIASNTTNIATNAASIVSNDSDIAANAVNIATNDNDIATNASNISSNDTDIATNASNIFGNSSNISTNSAAIANLVLSDLTNVSSTSPTAGQVLKWGGSEWAPGTDATSAGGANVDTIANASEATNYTGTSKFIHITSTADVTFTNTAIEDRIIYCSSNIIVKFKPESFKNNIVKMSGSSSVLTIESPHDGAEAGNETNVHNCDIQCKNVLNLISGVQDPVGAGEEPLDLHITNCTINANQISLSTIATLDTDQRVYVESSNINCAIFQNTKDDDNTAFVKFGSKVVAQYVSGFFDVDNGGSIECLDGSNSQTVRIDIGSTTYLNSAYSLPFVASSNGIETSIVAIASTDAGQSIPNATLTDVVYEDEEVDNTSSYNTSTGIFTAPVKGFYAINARILFGSNSNFDIGDMTYIQVYKNSTGKITGHINESVVTDSNNILYGSGVAGGVLLDVGDTLRVRIYQSCGVAKGLLNQGDDNYIQIYKIN